MRPPALACLVALLAAGCVAPAALDPASDEEAGAAPERVADVVRVVDELGGMGEPSLGVTPDGVLFTTGRNNDGMRFDSGAVFRSRDDGATWEKVGAPTWPMPNLDPDLAVDADGVVWMNTLWVGCVTVAVSHDQGESWSPPNAAACVPPAGDRQYVIPTRGGTAYVYAHNLPTFYQVAAKTTDYGRTWVPTGPVELPDHHLLVNEGSGWGGGGFWNPSTDSVFLTFTWFVTEPPGPTGARVGHPAYAVTRDGGLTWEIGRLDAIQGRYHGLSLVVGAADDAGNVYLAWSGTDEDDSGVFLAASRDDGRTWTKPVRVDADNRSNVFPAITAGGDGGVAVAYYEADAPGHPNEVHNETTWNVTLAWTSDAFADAPAFERGQLSANPAKRGPICPSGTGCGGNRQLLDYFSVKRLADGRAAAVWTSTLDVEDKVVNVFGATAAPVLPAKPL